MWPRYWSRTLRSGARRYGAASPAHSHRRIALRAMPGRRAMRRIGRPLRTIARFLHHPCVALPTLLLRVGDYYGITALCLASIKRRIGKLNQGVSALRIVGRHRGSHAGAQGEHAADRRGMR